MSFAQDSGERVSAAVLVPVFRDAGDELRLVLVVRTGAGMHGGQVSLPGGKQEETDGSLTDTALREAEEEIGVTRDRVQILAELTPMDTHTTGFTVFPFLARVEPPKRWRLARGEVAAVATPLVHQLVDASSRHERLVSFPTWPEPRRVECVVLDDGHVVWGLTLRLLDSIVPRILGGEWRL
jgi:8-oxo-dGTP pyrophosphatase MutT (NUDIX family)